MANDETLGDTLGDEAEGMVMVDFQGCAVFCKLNDLCV